MQNKKKTVYELLERNDAGTVVSLAGDDRKIVSLLVRLAYDKNTLVGWRAIMAIGLAARGMLPTDLDFLHETCRKLLWSLSDESGGIGWSAPEMLGEIVSADPKRFKDFIPLIASVYEIEEDVFRGGVLFGAFLLTRGNSVLTGQGLCERICASGVYGAGGYGKDRLCKRRWIKGHIPIKIMQRFRKALHISS